MNLLPILFIFLMACSSTNVSDTTDPSTPQNDANTSTSMPEGDEPPMKKEGNEITLWVSHYRVPCVGEGDASLCYLAQEGTTVNEDNWEYFYDAIQGFDNYELGSIYQLKIRKTERKSVPEDAGSFDYSLMEIVSKEKVAKTTTFDIALKMDPNMLPFIMKKSGGEEFYLFDEIKVELGNPTLKAKLEQAIKGGSTFAGTFTHSDSPNTIVLKSLQVD